MEAAAEQQEKMAVEDAYTMRKEEAVRMAELAGMEIADTTARIEGSAAYMNDLDALYYMGDLVEQDYAKAAELYEMAADAGCYQSVINLGYIYKYGRIGGRISLWPCRWYSLAPSCEAAYKLGDMFARRRAVSRDMKKAYRLYSAVSPSPITTRSAPNQHSASRRCSSTPKTPPTESSLTRCARSRSSNRPR